MFVEVPVNVAPFGKLNGLIVFVEVSLRLLDAIEKDYLEAGNAEEGHGDANFQIRTQIGLYILSGELS